MFSALVGAQSFNFNRRQKIISQPM